MGIELAKEADLCLLVHPANQELGVILDLQNEIGDVPSLLVVTHMDLENKLFIKADCFVSNKTRTGITEIKNKIRTLLGLNNISENKHVSLSQRQQSLFQRIAEHVEISAEALGGFLGPAVATEEITLALEALAELRGSDAREAVLDQLFSKFCIGK